MKKIGYVQKDTRWTATIVYRVTKTETRTIIHHVQELSELEQLVEESPTFCAIKSFMVEYRGPKETIEESRKS